MHYLGQDTTSQTDDQLLLEEIENLSVKHGIKTGVHDGISDLTKYAILGGALLLFSQYVWPTLGRRLRERYL